MNDFNVLIPESYQFFRKNKNAFEQIEGQRNLPPHFNWEDVLAYNQAKFSFEVVKYETFLFANELWEKTWGQALKNEKEFISCSVETYQNYEVALFTDDIWSDCVTRLFSRGKQIYWFGIVPKTAHDCINLLWYVGTIRGRNVCARTSIDPEIWEEYPDNCAWRVTKSKFCLLSKDDAEIDCQKLYEAAREIIEMCKGDLG